MGDPRHFIEPCFGSGAVLLARPNYDPTRHVETVNDADGFVANAWRSMQFAPDEVARWCDWPVNHADLCARKLALQRNRERLLEGLASDPKWHDAELAGYWIWGMSCWIGTGFMSDTAIPNLGKNPGINALGKRPRLAGWGEFGVNRIDNRPPDMGQIPNVSLRPSYTGTGINVQSQILPNPPNMGGRPHLADFPRSSGKGVHIHGQRDPESRDVPVTDPYNVNLYKWFRQLSERLRYVRVVCGDWSRVCGGNWQDNRGDVGIYFDPPYGTTAKRQEGIYSTDSLTVADDIREWCLERGSRPTYRIVLSGYYEEHESLLSAGWTATRWKAAGGYAKGGSQAVENSKREALFLSPHCLRDNLFGE